MAKLHITELTEIPLAPDGTPLWIADMSRIVVEQVVVYSANAVSQAFDASTRFVRLFSDAKVFLHFAGSPVATNQNIPMAADSPEYFAVSPGSKVAAYDGVT